MEYEISYLIGESKKPELDKIKKGVEEIIIKEGGSFLETEITKERKMSYEIKNEARGIYITRRFKAPAKDSENYNPNTVVNITKKLNLSSDILRFIIVSAGELPELKKESTEKNAQSITMKNKEKSVPKVFSSPIIKAGDKKIPTETEKQKNKEVQEDIDKKLEEILKI